MSFDPETSRSNRSSARAEGASRRGLRRIGLCLATASILAMACATQGTPEPDTGVSEPAGEAASKSPAWAYPQARRSDHVDTYHGTEVADPYRWMEDLDSEELRGWIDAQNALTFGYLEKLPTRAAITRKLEALWNYERRSAPFERGGTWFVYKNDGLQNHSVLYKSASPDGALEMLLDPNALSEDGTVSLSAISISDDGKYLAYATSASGSDWRDWHVREVATGTDLEDHIQWTKFIDASWAPDGSGFYYGGYEAPKGGDEYEEANYFQKLYFHTLGTPQSEDRLVYERKDQKEWEFQGRVSDDGKFLIVDVSLGTDTRNGVFFQKLGKTKKLHAEKGEMVELLADFDASYEFIDNDGPVFWFVTDLNAPRGRVVAIDTRKPAREAWVELIPESADTLDSVRRVGDQFIATYMSDARSKVRAYGLDGKLVRELELPGLGTVGGFGGDRKDDDAYFSYRSFTQPSSVFHYDLKSGKVEPFWAPKLGFNPDDYVTEQVFYGSYDGTRVPMFITRRKDLKIDGNAPTYLYAYGGFNISKTPTFTVPDLVWLEMGGVYALPNIRGGGEYGKNWHEAGTKLQKQNVFDDFAAAAEWLVAEGYTKRDRLCIGGRSNGGLLMGASVTQHPELFGCVLAGVGVMDMLRFHQFTIGWAWVSDYGSSDDPEQFKALRAYSPVHNVKPETAYPPTMIYTADHDDRVVPSHSFKFAAAMQDAQAGDAPVMIRIDTKAGHGSGKPTAKQIEEWADLWAFAAEQLQMTLPENF